MDAWQSTVNVVVLLLEATVLLGLLVHGRAQRMLALPVYLALLFGYGTIVILHLPFLTWRTWIAKELLLAAVKVTMGVELAARLFARLPRLAPHARRHWTLVVLLAVAVALLDLPLPSHGLESPANPRELAAFEIGLRWLPRLNHGLAWLFLALYGLALYYAIVLDPLHDVVVPSFGAYLAVYSLSLGMLQAEHEARRVSDVQTLSFLVMLVLWTWAAWRREKEPGVARVKLQRVWPWM